MSQGVGYAVGAGLAYAPTILFLDEWFVVRKGFAYGVMWVSIFSNECGAYSREWPLISDD